MPLSYRCGTHPYGRGMMYAIVTQDTISCMCVCVCVCEREREREREREMIMASQGAIGLNIFKIANFHLKQPII